MPTLTIHRTKRVKGKKIPYTQKIILKKKPRKKPQKCIHCGCTQRKACPGGCYWIKPNLCSQCYNKKR